MALLCCAAATRADEKHPVTQAQILAEQAYDAAKSRHETNKNDARSAWEFARACFDVADLADRDAERATFGRQGADACRELLKRDPENAAAHYYLGMNLGEIAQTKTFGALSLVHQMQKEWEAARELDDHFDFAGPDRNLGMLYRDAPGSPLSIGSRTKAFAHMVRAVQLAPDYPENRLNLIESLIKWDRFSDAAQEDEKLRDSIPAARKQLSGGHWENDWKDWYARLAVCEKKLTEWRNTVLQRRQ